MSHTRLQVVPAPEEAISGMPSALAIAIQPTFMSVASFVHHSRHSRIIVNGVHKARAWVRDKQLRVVWGSR